MLPTPVTHIPRGHEASPMRSPRDSDSVGRAWVKHNKGAAQAGADLRAIGKLQRDIERLRRRIVSGGQEEKDPLMHPFKIYNVPAGKALDTTKAWRSFRIRDGYVTVKGKYTANPTASGDGDETRFYLPQGNVVVPIGCDGVLGADHVAAVRPDNSDTFDFDSSQILDPTNPIVTYTAVEMVSDAVVYEASGPTEFVLGTQNGGGTTNARYGAAFWAEITDDGTTFSVKICGQMINDSNLDLPSSRAGSVSNKTIIPIGRIYLYGIVDGVDIVPNIVGQNLVVGQWLYDHLWPRADACVQNNIMGQNLTYRGVDGSDIDGSQIVWPGDVVTVSGGVFGGHANDALYMWVGSPRATYTSPPGGYWRRIMRGRTD
jgi:hypothetical protein